MTTLTQPAALRELTPPPRLAARPRDDRGFVVPWFVPTPPPGQPYDFRLADGRKWSQAMSVGLCWLCGVKLGAHRAFVIGPMCAINRTSADPPAHLDCARYAVAACPFLARPRARRREGGLPEDAESPGGIASKRNPGVALIWLTRASTIRLERTYASDGHGVADGHVIRFGDPIGLFAYAEGRPATADELWTSIVTGYPSLSATAASQRGGGPMLRAHVHQAIAELVNLRLLTIAQLARIDVDLPPVVESPSATD